MQSPQIVCGKSTPQALDARREGAGVDWQNGCSVLGAKGSAGGERDSV
jgi:hypothetical protein